MQAWLASTAEDVFILLHRHLPRATEPPTIDSIDSDLVRIRRDRLLNKFSVHFLPSLLDPSEESITARLVALMVPFLVVLLDQSLVVELEGQFRVNGLLGALLFEGDGGLEDVFLRQVDFHRLWC